MAFESQSCQGIARRCLQRQEDDREAEGKVPDRGRQASRGRRGAEITLDLVLRARARMVEEEVHGPEDPVVTEMIRELPQEKIFDITKRFQKRLMGEEEAPSSW